MRLQKINLTSFNNTARQTRVMYLSTDIIITPFVLYTNYCTMVHKTLIILVESHV